MLRWASKTTLRVLKHSQRTVASAPTQAVTDKLRDDSKPETLHEASNEKLKSSKEETVKKSRLVSAAFESLKKKDSYVVEGVISAANSPEDLLSLVGTTSLSRKQAFKIVSILAEWSVNGRVNVEKYESDPRFITLCQQLGRPALNEKSNQDIKSTDLSVVLGVTGDDEAAKLVSTISLQQMIKVLSSLAAKKRRSTPLLRSIAFNIGSSTAKIDIKQGADILYSLATLNFPDEILLEKVCADLQECVLTCQKTAVIGSIATSLGLLRYKDSGLLSILCEWVVQKRDICRIHDLYAILHTLATVNLIPATPENFFQVVVSLVKEEEAASPLAWLDVVWSLVVLGKAEESHFRSVLSSDFIERLSTISSDGLSVSSKKKLLNINGAAKWTKGYKGSLIDSNPAVSSVPLTRSKEKQALITSVLDTLSNLLPSAIYLRPNVDTGMGFLLDGECLVDSKMTPLPVIDKKTGEPIQPAKNQKGTRIAIMVWDYHDFTRGKSELSGFPVLHSRLMSHSGYKVLSVPYTEYNQLEKLSVRVQYLEKKLKALVKPG